MSDNKFWAIICAIIGTVIVAAIAGTTYYHSKALSEGYNEVQMTGSLSTMWVKEKKNDNQ